MSDPRGGRLRRHVGDAAPGLLLCIGLTGAALLIERIEAALLGFPFVDALVIALLLGVAVRTFWVPGRAWVGGIRLSGGLILEIAVALLGASVSLTAILASGGPLLIGVVATVVVAFAISFLVGRAMGLSSTVSILVASGNSICGNSAIVAVAPVIGASARDIAGSIAFTAVLGVLVVLGLPLLVPLLRLSDAQYGTIAGLTVYAVPQVLAATLPVGLGAAQIATIVKMTRVLMLTPLLLVLSILHNRPEGGAHGAPKLQLSRLVPWFILAFVALAAIRSAGWLPDAVVPPATSAAKILTIVAMSALGLGVDVKTMREIGGPISACVVISLVALVLISIAVTWLVGID